MVYLHVIKRNMEVNIMLHLTAEGERVNRRNHFRWTCQVPIRFRFAKTEEQERHNSAEVHNGIITDLSAGGMKLMTRVVMEEKDRIFFTLDLDGVELFLLGEIKGLHGSEGLNNQFQYCVMFIGLSYIEQDKIVRYLFRKQTSNLNK